MTLQFAIGASGDRAVVHLEGRIDRDAASALDAAYEQAAALGPAALELDFNDVDYINSTGIALIVGVLAKARAAKTPLRAAGLTPHYQHIFSITRLSDFIEILEPAQPQEA